MTREQCRELVSRIIAQSRADEIFVTISALDAVTASIASNTLLAPSRATDIAVQLAVRQGSRYITVSGNALDDDSLVRLLRRAEEAGKEVPPSQSIVPFAGPSEVREAPLRGVADTAAMLQWCVDGAAECCARGRSASLLASGRLTVSNAVTAVASSSGLFLYQPSSIVHAQLRMTNADSTSSGYAEARATSTADVDPAALASRAADTCRAWKDPIELNPGRLTTLFEPQAVADLLMPFLRQFDQQAIDENRSALRKLDGTSRVGSEMFQKEFSIASDPHHPDVPSMPFTLDGQAVRPVSWVKGGIVESVTMSRALALRSGKQPLPFPTNLIMGGGVGTIEEMIASTERGLLVKGFANLTIEDPANCLLTGSTKDGVFLIERGRVTKAVQNLLIRETPVYLFRRIEALGTSVRTHPRGVYFPLLVPPLRITDVMYSRHSGLV